MIKKILNKILNYVRKILNFFGLDITNDGERVFMQYGKFNTKLMDVYQRAHYERYLFAQKLVKNTDVVADMACGTGYGTMLLSESAKMATGYDIKEKVIKIISNKYSYIKNANFIYSDLLRVSENEKFDKIISFETIEHLSPENVQSLFDMFYKSLKTEGELIFSTPYMQVESENAKKMGFHLIFNIDEEKIEKWLNNSGFKLVKYYFQNYSEPLIVDVLENKEFIIGVAKKVN